MRNLFSRIPRAVAFGIGGMVSLGVIALVVLTAVGAFAGTAGTAATPHTATPHTKASSTSASRKAPEYYVSIGDSYAVGYQPSPQPGATSGFTGYVSSKTHLRLVNFGCGGATTTSMLDVDGCTSPYGPSARTDAGHYPHQTQVAAAVAFVKSHHGHIGLITVSISGNTVTHCATQSSPTSCVLAVVPHIEKNVATAATQLRKAAGNRVPLIGITYPDVLLGLWVYPPDHPDTALATLSVTAFRSLLNPALTKAYHSAGGDLVDVTQAAGGYVPLSKTTTLAPYGTIPVAVASTCRLTWYCTQGNIHAKTTGYDLIGEAIVSRYRALTR